jgi:hypothetical protein
MAAAGCLLLVPVLQSQEGQQMFPLDQIHSGLHGVGRTVFEGNKIEEFQVDILGVLKNALAPKRDLILARLSGGPLERTGVLAGMSGSPVYVDGKLVGAVAISFPFAKEPIAGITPISQMLDVVPKGKPVPPAQALTNLHYRISRIGSAEGGRLIPDDNGVLPTDLSELLPHGSRTAAFSDLRLPLRFGGFSSDVVERFAPLFQQLGFELMQGGVLSGSNAGGPTDTELRPGSMVSLLLVRGDLNLNVDCTVTYREGNNLFACGHRILSTGPAQFPIASSQVLVSVPSIAVSFKVDTPGPILGTLTQDRFSAVYGVVGDNSAKMIPVHIQLASSLNEETDYNFEIVQETLLSPLLLNLATVSALSTTERMVGPSTMEIKGKIRLAGGESVNLEDVFSGDVGAAGMAGTTAAAPLSYLLASGFPDFRIEGIDMSVVSINEKRAATLEQVWCTKSEVHPGDHIEVSALLRLPAGQTVTQKLPVEIPESVTDKALTLAVGSGASMNALQFRFAQPGATARDLHQLVRALNRMHRNNRLYGLLMAPQRSFIMQGDEYPSPPPSLVQTFLADPAFSSSVIFSGTSVVGDFQAKSSPYTIQGQKTLTLKVVGPGV